MSRKIILLPLAVMLLSAVAFSACGSDDSSSSDDDSNSETSEGAGASAEGGVPSGINLVEPVAASKLVGEPGVQVIDVRTPEEYDEGHIAGAEMIDFYSSDFGDEIAALDRDGEYVIYCRSGNRSGQAAALMSNLGFTHVADVDGGILAWEGAGLDVEK
ncbi:MAG: rhodanese-like domain-containing protein [Actinobacteria bacterium]|nr:rhodanese-like domain-containing protein [Actinomycetota bacterium]MCB9390387.1 rhodanese-like domain-containing protein [Acidimicrobiia bacterium]